jgi:hypothetical protein
VKTVQRRHPHESSDRSRVAFLLLLVAALNLVYWLTPNPSLLWAQESIPEGPVTCFLAANIAEDQPTPGILLAWRTDITDTTAIDFEFARAQFTKETDRPGVLVHESGLSGIQNRDRAENQDEWRYSVMDTQVVSGTKYSYVLTATQTISINVVTTVLTQTRIYSGAPIPFDNSEICLKGSTVTPEPTETPLPTLTPTPTWTDIPTITPTPPNSPTPTWTPTPTVTPTPTNTPIPSPLPPDTPYPSPTFTPLPTETPIPPTPTETPTETPSPTFTPVISVPTPPFGVNPDPNSQSTDPFNSSIMPTPTWTPFQENQPVWPEETPTPSFPSDSSSPQESMPASAAESAPNAPTEEAIPAQAALMAAENSAEAEDETLALAAPEARAAPVVPSEYRPTPTGDGSSVLRLALYTVGALALLSALAFLLGALALFGSKPRS